MTTKATKNEELLIDGLWYDCDMKNLFPILLMTLNVCASVTYFLSGDIKRGIYWIAACVLTACVTF